MGVGLFDYMISFIKRTCSKMLDYLYQSKFQCDVVHPVCVKISCQESNQLYSCVTHKH